MVSLGVVGVVGIDQKRTEARRSGICEEKWRDECVCTAVNGGAMPAAQDSWVKQSNLTYLHR